MVILGHILYIVTNQPALACAEQSGRTSIGYQRKVTRKDESRDYGT